MNASERYTQVSDEYRDAQRRGTPTEKQGKRLRDAALERADRREWAHKRRGDEARWAE